MPPLLFTLVRWQATRSARQIGHPRLLRGGTPLPAGILQVTGQTKDSTGAILAGVTVALFQTSTGLLQLTTTSDADGNYALTTPTRDAYYIVAYKAGSPDVAGTTVNTLIGT